MQVKTSLLSGKGLGFYVSMAAAALSFLTAIVYQVTYTGNQYYSVGVFVALLLALPVAVVLMLARCDGFIPAAVTLVIGIGILLFIYSMYFDVSVVLVGIDKSSFDPQFIACSVLSVVSFILADASIYLKVRK